MMYTDGVGRKKVDGNGKEYTISELVHFLSCDRENEDRKLKVMS